MKIELGTIKQIVITDALGLDPVRVMWENYNPGQGRITVTCYGRAWTAAWFAMAGGNVERFFVQCDPEYIMSNFQQWTAPSPKRNKKHDDAYLIRIIKAAQDGLRQHMDNEAYWGKT